MINDIRKEEMLKLYCDRHLTLEKIGRHFSISRERVRQIIGSDERYLWEQHERWRSNKEARTYTFTCRGCGKEKTKVLRNLSKHPPKYCGMKCLGMFWHKVRAQRTEKMCTQCKKIKPINHFYTVKKQSSNGKVYTISYGACADCHIAKTYEWREKHPERSREIMAVAGKKHYLKVRNDPVLWADYLARDRARRAANKHNK